MGFNSGFKGLIDRDTTVGHYTTLRNVMSAQRKNALWHIVVHRIVSDVELGYN